MTEMLCPYCQNEMVPHDGLDWTLHRGRGRRVLIMRCWTCKECGRNIYTVVNEDMRSGEEMKPVLKHGERPFDMKGDGLFVVVEESAVKSTCEAKRFDTYNEAWQFAIRQGLCPQGIYIRLSQIQMSVETHQKADLDKKGKPIDMSVRK